MAMNSIFGRRCVLILVCACTAVYCGPRPRPLTPPVPLSTAARAYLAMALDTIAAVTMGNDTIQWNVVRDSAFRIAGGAEVASDTYGAIDWALRRANKHSFLQARRPGAVTRIARGNIGYVHVPQRGGAAIPLADSLHSAVRAMGDSQVCGWIVDLRANGGGNMWPMLVGIGPLLGDTIVGSFGTGATADRWYYARGISGIMRPDGRIDTITQVTGAPYMVTAATPVAVLHDGGTGSSGEAVAIAFRGRPDTRSFGSRTAGFASVNRGSRLPDGANMVVTTGYNADRLRREYVGHVDPDVVVSAPVTDWPFPTDRVASAAADWMRSRPACGSGAQTSQR